MSQPLSHRPTAPRTAASARCAATGAPAASRPAGAQRRPRLSALHSHSAPARRCRGSCEPLPAAAARQQQLFEGSRPHGDCEEGSHVGFSRAQGEQAGAGSRGGPCLLGSIRLRLGAARGLLRALDRRCSSQARASGGGTALHEPDMVSSQHTSLERTYGIVPRLRSGARKSAVEAAQAP